MNLARFAIAPFLALVAAPFVAPAARADVILSNLATPGQPFTTFGFQSGTIYKAFSFTMGAQPYVLDDVVVRLNTQITTASPIVTLWSDGGGLPGVELFALDNPALTVGTSDYVFTAGSPFVLAAGVTYFLRVSTTSQLIFTWRGTYQALPSGAGATAGDYVWNDLPSSVYNRLEINGTPGGSVGSSYCGPAVPNSTGLSGQVSASGSLIAADNDLALRASNLPDGQFAYFLASQAQGFIPFAGGGQGNLCLGSPAARFNAQVGQVVAGVYVRVIDLTSVPYPPTFDYTVLAGETWNFQCWYRDVNPGATSNLTDALSIVYQ